MLGSVRPPGFSTTARSRPLHDKAGGGGDHFLTSSVIGWRHADDVVKGPAEGAQAAEAGVETDVGDALFGLAQHEHGSLHPPALKGAERRLSTRGRAGR